MKISIIVTMCDFMNNFDLFINSVLEQTYNNFELIIVDKGDFDVKSFMKKYNDSRIKIVSRNKNKKSSDKNIGLNESTGDYVCFLDPSVIISDCYLKEMINKCEDEKLDLCICDYFYIKNKRKNVELSSFLTTNLVESPFLLSYDPITICNKMFKRSVIIDNKIKFNEKYNYENILFNASLLYYADRIGKLDDNIVGFYVLENKNISDIFKVLDEMCNLYSNDKNVFLNEAIVSIVYKYIIDQKYQNDYEQIVKFVDESFDYFNKKNIDYKNSLYIIAKPFYKSFILKHEKLIKFYLKNNNIKKKTT